MIVLILLTFAHARAQDGNTLMLTEVLEHVDEHYPSIQRYAYEIDALTLRADGADAWMPPVLSVGAMRFPYDLSMASRKNDPMNQAGFAVAIEQMIPNGSKLDAKERSLRARTHIEERKRDWSKNGLHRQARLWYYQRAVAEKQLKVIADSREVLELLIAVAEARLGNEQASLQTVYKAKARLAELTNMQTMLEGVVGESSVGLNTLMMRNRDQRFSIDTAIAPRVEVRVTRDSVNVAGRSDLAVVTATINAMRQDQHAMSLGGRPDFGVRAEHMQMLGMPSQWSLMGMMTLPFMPWSSTMYTSATNAMASEIKAMELERESMTLMASRMAAERRVMLKAERTRYETFVNDVIPSYEQNLQVNLFAYRQNTGEFFVLLDAWEMVLMKRIEQLNALRSVLSLEVEIDYELER